MRLVVSNIAWPKDAESSAAKNLKKRNIDYIEVAPTKQWADPLAASTNEVKAYSDFWVDKGLQIVAIQSMLFNRPDLKIFENDDNRKETLEYLCGFIKLAARLGAQTMVFGSPKNRQRGTTSYHEAFSIAKDFFREIGKTAEKNGVIFCIEPNATQYGCDFVINTKQGIELVEAVNSPGIGLHLDTACMSLAGENIGESISSAQGLLKHFHISAPFLEQVEARPDVDYNSAAAALRSLKYDGFISIEMKPAEAGQDISRLNRAIDFTKLTFF